MDMHLAVSTELDDFNECSTAGNICGANAICTNREGTFSCLCNPGFTGSPPSVPCIDVDECAINPTRCGRNGVCENLVGRSQCNCNPGYRWPSPTSECVDINECANSTRLCKLNESCNNTGKSDDLSISFFVYKTFYCES